MTEERESIFPYPEVSQYEGRDMLRVRVNSKFELDMFNDGQINIGIYGTAEARKDDGRMTFVKNLWVTAYERDIPELIIALTYYLEKHVRHDV